MVKKLVQVVVVAAVAAFGSTVFAAPKAIPAAKEVTGVVNLNTGTVKELELLPGVGAKTAKLIVEYRAKQPFKTPAEVVKVKGVGKGIYAKIKDHITVSGPTTLAVIGGSKKTKSSSSSGGDDKPGMKSLK